MKTLPEWAVRGRAGWKYRGQARPSFAIQPGPDQESVWDYPRPPRLELDSRSIVVTLGSVTLAESARAFRVLETASAPSFYLPPEHVNREALRRTAGQSACEWKGLASYWNPRFGPEGLGPVAWSYPDPLSEFEWIQDHFGFFPDRVNCTLDGEPVAPQPGGFYGGWVTPEIVGPIKGSPGSDGW